MNTEDKEVGQVARLELERLRVEAAVLLERAAWIEAELRSAGPADPVSAEAMREVRDEDGAALVAAIREGRRGLNQAYRLLSRMVNGSETETYRCLADCINQLDVLLGEMKPVYVVRL